MQTAKTRVSSACSNGCRMMAIYYKEYASFICRMLQLQQFSAARVGVFAKIHLHSPAGRDIMKAATKEKPSARRSQRARPRLEGARPQGGCGPDSRARGRTRRQTLGAKFRRPPPLPGARASSKVVPRSNPSPLQITGAEVFSIQAIQLNHP